MEPGPLLAVGMRRGSGCWLARTSLSHHAEVRYPRRRVSAVPGRTRRHAAVDRKALSWDQRNLRLMLTEISRP